MEYRKAIWLAPLLLVIHNVEEYLTMSSILSRHAADLPPLVSQVAVMNSDHEFSIALVFVTLLAFLFTYLGTISKAGGTGMFLSITVQAVMLINGIQHIVASLWLGAYTPGVLTSVILYLPLLSYLLWRVYREGYESKQRIIYSFILGFVLLLPVILLAKWAAGFI